MGFAYKEITDMYEKSGTDKEKNKYLLPLAGVDKEYRNVKKILAYDDIAQNRKQNEKSMRKWRIDDAKSMWEIFTDGNKELIDYRVEVETKILDELSKKSDLEYHEAIKLRKEACMKQSFSEFEMRLAHDVKQQMALDDDNNPIDVLEPTLKGKDQIVNYIYEKVSAYYNNKFTYEKKSKKITEKGAEMRKKMLEKAKEEPVETIGV